MADSLESKGDEGVALGENGGGGQVGMASRL